MSMATHQYALCKALIEAEMIASMGGALLRITIFWVLKLKTAVRPFDLVVSVRV